MAEATDIDRQIAQRLLALRLSKGMTKEELGDAIGAKQKTITRLETGCSVLSATQLVLAARALGVTTSFLVGETPGDSPPA